MTNELREKTWFNNEMSELYDNFMIFSLHNSGEKERIDITEAEFLKNNGAIVLNPEEVLLIIKEDLRRIYIWKGTLSSVRKKFIASRVASELQAQLAKSANFHRCKIVSVDQGEEPREFLHNFGFKSIEKPELEPDKNFQYGLQPKEVKTDSLPIKKQKVTSKHPIQKPSLQHSYEFMKTANEMKKKVLATVVPDGYKRSNLILGRNLFYNLVSKKTEVFGKTYEETDWEPVTNGLEKIFHFDGYNVRIYTGEESGVIKAIELLEPAEKPKRMERKGIVYSTWTVKKLKEFCVENQIKILSKYRKAEIVKIVEEYAKEHQN